MRRILFTIALLAFLHMALADDTKYPREIARWQQISVPAKTDQGAFMVWSYAANYSPSEWRVFEDRGQACAELTTEKPRGHRERPSFVPKADRFVGGSAALPVEDGWLVGFNRGEFGAALYWFSKDGTHSYKISDHQVVDFFLLPTGIHAIEGLAHLSMSEGSVIRIERSRSDNHWRAFVAAPLPFAPYTISVDHNGTAYIVLSDALVTVTSDYKLTRLLSDTLWAGLYPNSSVLSEDQNKLYIGMRQFVGEFDLHTRGFRLLLPSEHFHNKLPRDVER
jgi:hypothetical protein